MRQYLDLLMMLIKTVIQEMIEQVQEQNLYLDDSYNLI